MELRLETIRVEDLLSNVANDFSRQIEERDLTLNIEISEDAGTLRADEKRLRQTIGHLLSNAVGFSPIGATLRMGARRDGSDVLLWVADNGRGMDAEFQKKAFERFNSQPAAGGHRGPGLGLALVKSIVELHGGSVRLMSKVQQGTTVICRLPDAGPRDKLSAPQAATNSEQNALNESLPASGSR
jgi:signal transduction histidine kinase